ncbi:hypothetical protein C1645_776791 [Glomus cerebriforme]|uniref:Uncharacterized protein n=1 Tax=Glomus cerebriforme TaxID=658196 RepID=A0A397SNQ9_9GLOM|nr:hypothetical protein C1645_776791 [Glomus cerebriforme]
MFKRLQGVYAYKVNTNEINNIIIPVKRKKKLHFSIMITIVLPCERSFQFSVSDIILFF